MKRVMLSLALLAGASWGAVAQTNVPSRQTTPGPTSDPATTNTSPSSSAGVAGMSTTPQSAPPTTPVPTAPPSGAPPDVMMVPK